MFGLEADWPYPVASLDAEHGACSLKHCCLMHSVFRSLNLAVQAKAKAEAAKGMMISTDKQ